MALGSTVEKQLSSVAEQSGMSAKDYAAYLGKIMPRASGEDKTKIAAQIYKSGACPLQGHATIMEHSGKHNLALNYDGWIAGGRRDGVTGINCEIIDKEGQPWAVKATVNKGEESYSRTEVIEENRAMGARNSKAWKAMPLRMTQHRAIISAIRCACSINSMASVEELTDAGFSVADKVKAPPIIEAAEKTFKKNAIFKGTGTIDVHGNPGVIND